MKQVNMLEAKTHLSQLVAALEEHPEEEIVISRHGRPVARLAAYERGHSADAAGRVGAARGAFELPEDIDAPFGDMEELFTAERAANSENNEAGGE